MKATLTGPSLSFTVHTPNVLVEIDDAQVPTIPGPVHPPPVTPTEPSELTGYDLNTSAALLEGFNNTLTVIPPADHVALAPIGFQFGSVPNIDGFLKQNSCYRWLAGLEIPTTGEYVFRLQSKSGGSLRINGELLWSVDREGDPTSSPAHIFDEEFNRTLEGGRVCPVVLTLIYQGFYHGSILEWKRPGDTEFIPVTTDYLHPPADWQTRVKKFTPAPPEPSPFIVPDAAYRSPELARRLGPDDWYWNKPIDQEPVDPLSDGIIARLGTTRLHPVFGVGAGMPFEVVADDVPKVPVVFDYADESDAGPYPIHAKPVLESGGGDGHLLAVQGDWLYELFLVRKGDDGKWHAGSGAVFNLQTGSRVPGWQPGWTSADAAGLPIVPGLVRPEEVAAGEIRHALRFTVQTTRSAYVAPATHRTHPDDPARRAENLPPMGARFRMRADVDLSGLSPETRTICQALKTYGMLVSDNGSNFLGLVGVPHAGWNDTVLAELKRFTAQDLEVVKMGPITESN